MTRPVQDRLVHDRRSRPHGPDAGFTLPELSVAMSISVLLMAAIGAIMVGSLKADRQLSAQVGSTADLRIALESMSRALRTATAPTGEPSALVVATPEALSFYTLAQHTDSTATPLPTLVEYSWDPSAGCLKEARTPARALSAPSGSGSIYAWDTGRSSSCLVRTSTAPTLATPWFTYYTTGTTSSSISTTDAGLSSADRQTVRSVAVSLTVAAVSSPDVAGAHADVRVNLANVVLARGGDA